MGNTAEMEYKDSERRSIELIVPKDVNKIKLEFDTAPALIVPEKKMYLLRSEFERRIDPLAFQLDADWLQYEPRTNRQKQTKELFLDARVKGRLHAFTCMAIDPSFDPVTGELVYQPGLPPAVGKSYNDWVTIFKNYAPERNSRVLAKTEGACKNLELIRRLVEWRKVTVEDAWDAVCDHSAKLGHFADSDNAQNSFEATGSREICGFYDLGNVYKILAEDSWEKAGGFWAAGGSFDCNSNIGPLADLYRSIDVVNVRNYGLGQLGLD